MSSCIYAFGFNFGGTQGTSAWLNQVVLPTGETFGHYDGTYPNFAFFGVLSDDPFASLMFRTGSEFSDAIIDNFMYAQDTPTPAPEPATLLLLASGVIGLGAVRRKYKK
jgi:hypothetical protein